MRHRADDDRAEEWDLGEGLDPEGPSGEDLHRFGSEMTRCASCGREVYDQAEICTVCGGPVHAPAGRAAWWIWGVAVVLVVVIVWVWVL